MNDINNVKKEIENILECLIKSGMSVQQQYPIIKEYGDDIKRLEWNNITNLSVCLKNIDYSSIYNEINKNRDYTFKLVDGNIIQLLYTFKNGKLYSHRLAMFPSPDLEAFQNEPEIYEQDEIYADILSKKIVSFPLRFDYCVDDIESTHNHPHSHVSLGEYKNCRIPAYGPVSPQVFMNFVLENFYNTYFLQIYSNYNIKNRCNHTFTIKDDEKKKIHFSIV